MKEKDVVDLVQGKDGIYCAENTPVKIKVNQQKKLNNNMDQFFNGMDLGLDFVEGMQRRVKRILKLRD